ncbi:MAG: hypothetical protein S0880_01580 [Actinomycetota bacterium]|nr:hypothetical protein [Actinomycetota bacterium]
MTRPAQRSRAANRTATVAEMALRELARRRGVLVILALFPLAFYLARRDQHLGQSVRFVCLGIGWALATAALFAGSAARSVEQRLRLSGYESRHLVVGRLASLWAVALAVTVPYFLLVRLDGHDHTLNFGAIAAIMALTVVVAPAFGLAVSAVLPRDLEGMLVLLVVIGVQMIMDPANPVARFLPFWYVREIATYAVDHTSGDYLLRGLVHGVGVALLLTAVVVALAHVRLRRRPHVELLPTA